MKVTRTVYNAIFNILIAVIMSTMMSFVLTLVNVGMVDGFIGIWMQSLLVACLVAIPVTFITIPLVSKMLKFIEVV